MRKQNWVNWIGFCAALLVVAESSSFLSVAAMAVTNPMTVENQNPVQPISRSIMTSAQCPIM